MNANSKSSMSLRETRNIYQAIMFPGAGNVKISFQQHRSSVFIDLRLPRLLRHRRQDVPRREIEKQKRLSIKIIRGLNKN